MKKIAILIGAICLAAGLAFADEGSVTGTEGDGGEKRVSPYFNVTSEDTSVDGFPLLETRADVKIAGVVAETRLVQVYKNNGKKTIEAVYVFPLGTKTAVHSMRMRVGERTIEATIEERQAASKIYEQAKQDGKTASLLEQERPNVFQMKVANIMPGDKVEVEVGYTELLIPTHGIYEFIYPTVVGPRYGGEVKEPKENDQWISSPYQHEKEEPSYKTHIKVSLKTGITLEKVWTPSHDVKVTQNGDEASVELSDTEKSGGNRDFILRYTMAGKTIQSGLLLYPGAEEKFFLLMAQPPERIMSADIPSREYVFIVDVSGSMNGFPLNVSKEALRKILDSLREKDYFNIMFFSGGSYVLSQAPLKATPENIRTALQELDRQNGGGGTEMLAAIKSALALEKREGVSRTIVILTDGYVGVEKEIFEYIRGHLSDANFFAFGIGTSVNRFLIEGIARAGAAESFIAVNEKEARKEAERFTGYVSSPLLTDIEVEYRGFEAYDVEPINVPDLFAERPLILFGKYKGCGGSIIIKGKTPSNDYYREIKVGSGSENDNNTALKYLWARERIAQLGDYGKAGGDAKDAITKLGLKYSLMTDYTSFVAVDTVKRATGESVTVKQPLPLPQGTNDYAVGGPVGAARAGMSGMYMNKCAQLASYAPAMECQDSSLTESIDRKVDLGRSKPSVFIASSTLPAGITLKEVEAALKKAEHEIGKLFSDWGLKKAHVVIELVNGAVKEVRVTRYEGKEIEKEVLQKALGSLSYPKAASGRIELDLCLSTSA